MNLIHLAGLKHIVNADHLIDAQYTDGDPLAQPPVLSSLRLLVVGITGPITLQGVPADSLWEELSGLADRPKA